MKDKGVDFQLTSGGAITSAFLERGISGFAAAMDYVKMIPYGRNHDKTHLLSVLSDHCGTCSTKHALLKLLADENGRQDIKLMLCLFRMNAHNTPAISGILQSHGLDHIPEAHNYLRWERQIFDVTFPGTHSTIFVKELISEVEIEPQQITGFKVNFHKEYLRNWLKNTAANITMDELWEIREACIKRLGHTSA